MSLRDNNKRDEGTNICSLNIFKKQKKNSQFPRPRPKLSLLNFLFFSLSWQLEQKKKIWLMNKLQGWAVSQGSVQIKRNCEERTKEHEVRIGMKIFDEPDTKTNLRVYSRNSIHGCATTKRSWDQNIRMSEFTTYQKHAKQKKIYEWTARAKTMLVIESILGGN